MNNSNHHKRTNGPTWHSAAWGPLAPEHPLLLHLRAVDTSVREENETPWTLHATVSPLRVTPECCVPSCRTGNIRARYIRYRDDALETYLNPPGCSSSGKRSC